MSDFGRHIIIGARIAVGGWSLSAKGGDAMYVTYPDLIQIGIFIVALIALCKTGDK